MRKNVFIGGLMIGCILLGGIINESKHQIKTISPHSSSMIAMYIQDENGNYQLSDAQEFPKDGYILNTEKSSCKNGGVISQNANTKALSLKVKTSDECTLYFDTIKGPTVGESAKTILAKANDASITNYNSGNKHEMFVFDHNTITTDNNGNTYTASQVITWTEEERRDYRYIGNEPYNYITFNDETWRIIGIFTIETESGEKETLLKIIRNQSIGNIAWDSNTVYSNEWLTATLQILLNEDYYNQTGNYTSNGLNLTARNQIAKVKWYLGSLSTPAGLEGPNYYVFERGTETCTTRGTCNGQTHSISIMQNVGLMYPSDYIFTYAYGADEKCYTDGYHCGANNNGSSPKAGWLFNNATQWTISPRSSNETNAFSIYTYGMNSADVYYGKDNGVRPCVYLNSSVKITGGDGSQGNPYTIE